MSISKNKQLIEYLLKIVQAQINQQMLDKIIKDLLLRLKNQLNERGDFDTKFTSDSDKPLTDINVLNDLDSLFIYLINNNIKYKNINIIYAYNNESDKPEGFIHYPQNVDNPKYLIWKQGLIEFIKMLNEKSQNNFILRNKLSILLSKVQKEMPDVVEELQSNIIDKLPININSNDTNHIGTIELKTSNLKDIGSFKKYLLDRNISSIDNIDIINNDSLNLVAAKKVLQYLKIRVNKWTSNTTLPPTDNIFTQSNLKQYKALLDKLDEEQIDSSQPAAKQKNEKKPDQQIIYPLSHNNINFNKILDFFKKVREQFGERLDGIIDDSTISQVEYIINTIKLVNLNLDSSPQLLQTELLSHNPATDSSVNYVVDYLNRAIRIITNIGSVLESLKDNGISPDKISEQYEIYRKNLEKLNTLKHWAEHPK